jgi:hypothetical protein
VWTNGLGYVVLMAVLGALVFVMMIPETVTSAHRRRELLKALIRRLP